MDHSRKYCDAAVLGLNLIWLRKQHDLSQKQMAKQIKISSYSLRQLEQGHIPPRLTIEFLQNIQDQFDYSPSQLLTEPLWEQNTATN